MVPMPADTVRRVAAGEQFCFPAHPKYPSRYTVRVLNVNDVSTAVHMAEQQMLAEHPDIAWDYYSFGILPQLRIDDITYDSTLVHFNVIGTL